jgi:hypothetical protein
MSLGVTENCDMQCAGNANETCGGALALDVYEIMDRYWEVPGGAQFAGQGVLCQQQSSTPCFVSCRHDILQHSKVL